MGRLLEIVTPLHKATKRDYLVAVVQAAADEMLRLTEPDPELELIDQLRRSVEAYVAYVEANRVAFVALVRGAVGSDPRLLAVFEDTRERIYERVRNRLGLPDDAPPVLRNDFLNSLCAAYRPDEVARQLASAGLERLQVEVVSDRHLIVFGRLA